jgi:hypothetical protein
VIQNVCKQALDFDPHPVGNIEYWSTRNPVASPGSGRRERIQIKPVVAVRVAQVGAAYRSENRAICGLGGRTNNASRDYGNNYTNYKSHEERNRLLKAG